MSDHRIGTLWTGAALGWLERLSLVSFVAAGHRVTLYTYAPVAGVPDGVETADAAAILPREAEPAAPLADRFRYCLLAACDDVIWAEPDVCCLAPLAPIDGHLHGWESERHVSPRLLRLPPGNATLAALAAFTADPHAIPDWLPPEERKALRAAKYAGRPVRATPRHWAAWAPRALTWFLHRTGDIRFTLPRAVLHPVAQRNRRLLLRPAPEAAAITQQSAAIPLHGVRLRRQLQDTGGRPPPGSLLAELLRRHGIDPDPQPAPPHGA